SACATVPEGSSPGPAASCATKVRPPTVAPTENAGCSEASHGVCASAAPAGSSALAPAAPAAARNERREGSLKCGCHIGFSIAELGSDDAQHAASPPI